jgi:hypothetical protein
MLVPLSRMFRWSRISQMAWYSLSDDVGSSKTTGLVSYLDRVESKLYSVARRGCPAKYKALVDCWTLECVSFVMEHNWDMMCIKLPAGKIEFLGDVWRGVTGSGSLEVSPLCQMYTLWQDPVGMTGLGFWGRGKSWSGVWGETPSESCARLMVYAWQFFCEHRSKIIGEWLPWRLVSLWWGCHWVLIWVLPHRL